jgi:hypothetical protein
MTDFLKSVIKPLREQESILRRKLRVLQAKRSEVTTRFFIFPLDIGQKDAEYLKINRFSFINERRE